MQVNRSFARASALVILSLSVWAPLASAQDGLQTVKDLYASAAYEDALSAVGKLDPATPSLEAEQYRVFCLVALGRMDEADTAVEAVLMAHPEYRPDPAQASPRIQTVFSQVRRRIGPALVKKMYQQGKAAMERKDRAEAVSQFEAMLRIANDPDVRGEANVAELKELGSGFLELSKAIPEKAVPAPDAPAAPAIGTPARPSVVVPPVVVRQTIPSWLPDPASRGMELRGAVRVQIGADGKVTSAEIVKSIHPAYDQILLRAAKLWVYQPARRDGVAITAERTVEVVVQPSK
jgi:TonB family protein